MTIGTPALDRQDAIFGSLHRLVSLSLLPILIKGQRVNLTLFDTAS